MIAQVRGGEETHHNNDSPHDHKGCAEAELTGNNTTEKCAYSSCAARGQPPTAVDATKQMVRCNSLPEGGRNDTPHHLSDGKERQHQTNDDYVRNQTDDTEANSGQDDTCYQRTARAEAT